MFLPNFKKVSANRHRSSKLCRLTHGQVVHISTLADSVRRCRSERPNEIWTQNHLVRVYHFTDRWHICAVTARWQIISNLVSQFFMPSVCASISLQICHLFVLVPLYYAIWMWRVDLSNSAWKIPPWLCIFSVQILLEKVLKKWYLLAESWFWLCIFSAQILLETVLKIKISKLLVESWFWLLLFPFQILLQKLLKN